MKNDDQDRLHCFMWNWACQTYVPILLQPLSVETKCRCLYLSLRDPC